VRGWSRKTFIARYLAAVYGRVPLPAEITTPELAEAFGCEYAKQHGQKVCLALSRKNSVWIDAQGQVYARTEATPEEASLPFKTRFLLGFGESGGQNIQLEGGGIITRP